MSAAGDPPVIMAAETPSGRQVQAAIANNHGTVVGCGAMGCALLVLAVVVIFVLMYRLNQAQQSKGGWYSASAGFADPPSCGGQPWYSSGVGGNLVTGSNLPYWNQGSGHAGEGGSMDSHYQPGESRVWASSAEGPHVQMPLRTGYTNCSAGPGTVAPEDANMHIATQSMDPGVNIPGSISIGPKGLDDATLVQIMQGDGMPYADPKM
jgi:hypothetical protein